ncbi:hypothetical protein F506_14660 [Herbaspirillum hiltneri N3]|uniref:OB fold (BOF) protein n=1 Tax=Herbaspirillum hiltneri N3 TaxID=1262470 RepID=A0ABN4I2A1_9BURK|nr:NirD/YgiW/YdeI family stress tolerance protein [Herbaspirillum hiltneri]AKZ63741.1 hypothetical protein F506_14660 [Herbaspirillum hiltneri N3]
MKKSTRALACWALVTIAATSAIPVFAQYTGPSHKPAIQTVASAAKSADDTPVVLVGTIIAKLRDEHYTFQDGSGKIEIEIDDKHFPSTPINETTKVRIHGKVDKHFGKDATIDVKKVEPF